MAHLFPFLPHNADETPISWATRLSALHTGGRLVPFLNDLGITYLSIIAGASDAFTRLCDATGQDPAPVLRNTVQKIGKRSYNLRGQVLSAEMLVRPDTRFCPACLLTDSRSDLPVNAARYGRVSWQLKTIRTCPVHNMSLIARRLGQWDDILSELPVIVPESTDALQGLAEAAVKRAPSPLQNYVLQRINGAKTHPWLDSLSLELATTVTEKLGAILTFGTDAKPRELSEADWDAAGAAGWAFSSRDERGVCEALALMQKRAADTRTNGIRKTDIFGMTYPWLANRRTFKDLEPVRRVFRGHYLATMTGLPDELVFGQPIEEPKFSTPNKIATLEGVDPRTLRNVLVGKGLVPAASEEGAYLDISVPYADALAVAVEMKRAVSANKGMTSLNASRPIWQILIDKGYLSGIGVAGEHSTVRCKAVDQVCIDQLLQLVEDLTDQVDVAPPKYRDLAKCAEICRVPLDAIIPAFLDGRLKTAKRLRSAKGMKAILLDTDDVTSLFGTSTKSK